MSDSNSLIEDTLKLDRLRQKILQREAEIAQLTERLDSILFSRSWRLTQPLRLMARLVRYPESTSRDIARRFLGGKWLLEKESRRSHFAGTEGSGGSHRKSENEEASFVEAVAEEFAVTTAFVEAYFSNRGTDVARYANWADFVGSLDSLNRMYVEFALTTTMRGRRVAQLLADRLMPHVSGGRTPRYLDVGCGYGGFLRAFSERGFEVTGLELVPQFADFSRRNVEDISNANIVEADFLAYPLEALGRFDCVTCNDVIEHVGDAGLALERLSSLIREDGILFLEIPNKDCIDFVASDGHFQIFAINCMERTDAARYYEAMTANGGYLDHMGEFYELEYYVEALRGKGLDVEVVCRHTTGQLEDAATKIVDLERAHQRWMVSHGPSLDDEIVAMVEDRYEYYRRRLNGELLKARAGDKMRFARRYLSSFWTLIAHRP